jgi:DNA/RNA endonuclease YhcR with UshA esterase domain
MKTLIFSILIILTYNISYSQTEISSEKAKYYVGENVLITGKIKEIKESSAGNIFLNFEKKYPNNPCTIVIYAGDREKILSNFRINWVNLVNVTLTVSGIIETYENRPEIVLRKAEQIVGIN